LSGLAAAIKNRLFWRDHIPAEFGGNTFGMMIIFPAKGE
jgi:hypothetical protein